MEWSALALASGLLFSADLDGRLLGRRHLAVSICVYKVGVAYLYTCVFLYIYNNTLPSMTIFLLSISAISYSAGLVNISPTPCPVLADA